MQYGEFQSNVRKKIPPWCCSNRFKTQPGKGHNSYLIPQALFWVGCWTMWPSQVPYNLNYSTILWIPSYVFTVSIHNLLFAYMQLREVAFYTGSGWFSEFRTLSYCTAEHCLSFLSQTSNTNVQVHTFAIAQYWENTTAGILKSIFQFSES